MNKYNTGLLITIILCSIVTSLGASEKKSSQFLEKLKRSVAVQYACVSGIIPFLAAVEYTNDALGRETLDDHRKFLGLRPIGTREVFVRYFLGHYVQKNLKYWPIHCCAIPVVLWHTCKD